MKSALATANARRRIARSNSHPHQQAHAKPGFHCPGLLETANRIELPGVRIPDYAKSGGISFTGNLRAVSHQRARDSATAHSRVDKQRIKFARSVFSGFYSGKSDDSSVPFRHE